MHYKLNENSVENIRVLGLSLEEIATQAELRRFRLKRKQEGETIRGADAWAIARVYAAHTGVNEETAMHALFMPVSPTRQNTEGTLLVQEYDAALSDMQIGDAGEIRRAGADLVQMRRALIGAARRRDMRVEIITIREDLLTGHLKKAHAPNCGYSSSAYSAATATHPTSRSRQSKPYSHRPKW